MKLKKKKFKRKKKPNRQKRNKILNRKISKAQMILKNPHLLVKIVKEKKPEKR